jgi:iron(III) transport system permease protein
LFALLLYATSKLLFGRTSYAMMAKATSAPRAKKLSRLAEFSCLSAFIFVIGLSLLPHLGVVLLSVAGDWYQTILPSSWTASHFQAALSHDLTVPSIQNSLKYASLAAILDLILGVAIAWVVVRTRSPARHALDACAMLPLAVPGLVLAFGYVAMSQEGRAFSFLNPASDPTALLVIAYGMRRLPYVVRSAAAGFEQISPALEEAAVNLGATPLRALRRVTLPLISANIFVGGLLAFSFAMLEVSDSLILAQKQVDFPITRAIFELFNLLGEGRFLACALGVWAMIFLGASLLAINRILGRKLGALFRVS